MRLETRHNLEHLVVIRLVPCVLEYLTVAHDAVTVNDEDGTFGNPL